VASKVFAHFLAQCALWFSRWTFVIGSSVTAGEFALMNKEWQTFDTIGIVSALIHTQQKIID
jgi:uncharacterized membrane protein YjjP (DUF1212 family)